MTTYIVASNAAHARVFAHEVGVIKEVDHLDHPESQAHVGDLRTGEGGKEGSGSGHSRPRATGNQQATSDKHAAFFASELAEYLKKACDQGRADKLILVAEPRFLGVLRQKLDHPASDAVIREVDKDLTKQKPKDIAKSLDLFLHD